MCYRESEGGGPHRWDSLEEQVGFGSVGRKDKGFPGRRILSCKGTRVGNDKVFCDVHRQTS